MTDAERTWTGSREPARLRPGCVVPRPLAVVSRSAQDRVSSPPPSPTTMTSGPRRTRCAACTNRGQGSTRPTPSRTRQAVRYLFVGVWARRQRDHFAFTPVLISRSRRRAGLAHVQPVLFPIRQPSVQCSRPSRSVGSPAVLRRGTPALPQATNYQHAAAGRGHWLGTQGTTEGAALPHTLPPLCRNLCSTERDGKMKRGEA